MLYRILFHFIVAIMCAMAASFPALNKWQRVLGWLGCILNVAVIALLVHPDAATFLIPLL